MIQEWVFLVIGFVLLALGANYLTKGASALASRLGISDMIAGLTIVAFSTSCPELVVNIESIIKGTTDLALTNIIGSNTINTLLILGVSAVITPIVCDKRVARFDVPFNILVSIVLLICAMTFGGRISTKYDGLNYIDGILLLLLFVLYMFLTIRYAKKHDCGERSMFVTSIFRTVLYLFGGLFVLIYGAQLIVDSAVHIATDFGVSEAVIGLTIIAIGTSLPELATSVAAAIKGQTDMAIGNVIGSNIINITLILGVSSLFGTLMPYQGFLIDGLVSLGAVLLLYLLVLVGKGGMKISRVEGMIMLMAEIIYTLYLIL